MRYLALATEINGTIAHNGEIQEPTFAALERLRGASSATLAVGVLGFRRYRV